MTQQNNSTTPREREYIRMRNLLLTVSLVFLTASLGLAATQIRTVSMNRQSIKDHEVRLKDVENYKASVYQFSDLVRSIMIYTNHMTSIVAGDQEEVTKWQAEYEILWREINFRNTKKLQSNTRSGNSTKEE
jgi:hypothetical protein